MTPEEAQALVGREFIHFKGNRYRLLSIAKHSETLEPFVVYQALYGRTIRDRSRKNAPETAIAARKASHEPRSASAKKAPTST